MPHLAAVAFDSLIAPGTSRSSADKSNDDSMTVSGHPLSCESGSGKKLENVQRRQMIPSLYTTPEATPLPYSPSSFPPSPYVIDHKRRGPRLAKTPLEVFDALSLENVTEKPGDTSTPGAKSRQAVEPTEDVPVNVSDPVNDSSANGSHEFSNREASQRNFEQKENSNGGLIGETDCCMSVLLTPTKEGDSEDFYDPRDSVSYSSNTDVEDYGSPARKSKIASSGGEFYDAWEELSSENGHRSSLRALEDELRETRLSLLMEIDRRKQAEEALRNMQNQWQTMREQLSLVGITLPAHPTEESERLCVEELSQQVQLARFVSEAVGKGIAKAEAETVVRAQLEAKNFEITRLSDRLHYYETVNREMSQRNQEGIEISRRRRQLRRRKQRWIWGSIAAIVAVGATAALSWSYLQPGEGSASSDHTPPTPSSEVDSLPKNRLGLSVRWRSPSRG